MTDTVDPITRKRIMARVGRQNTGPEKKVRSLLHRLGFRFRLHRKDLPGCPDIVLPKFAAVIQVHGCFWHRHSGCPKATTPSTNRDFWERKFKANVDRDERTQAELEALGWRVITVWECETQDLASLTQKLDKLLVRPVEPLPN